MSAMESEHDSELPPTGNLDGIIYGPPFETASSPSPLLQSASSHAPKRAPESQEEENGVVGLKNIIIQRRLRSLVKVGSQVKGEMHAGPTVKQCSNI